MDVNITLFVVSMVCAIAAVTLALVRQMLFYTRRARIDRQQEQNRALTRKQQALTDAWRGTQEAVRQAEQDRKVATTQLAELHRRIQQAAADNYLIVHELGDPGSHRQCFSLQLSIASTIMLGQTTVKDCHLRHVRHMVEVWADNAEEATRIARAAFSPDAGFSLSKPAPSMPLAAA
ncbi:hypothetical protein [Niveispirillum irakense]|uniref:hypothetical protein n=1 Tax=Niveispirillum irakense TaxID=34011 RepID=UPI0003FD5C9B|nr:hypothetical protein [Niveispirillum irakense]